MCSPCPKARHYAIIGVYTLPPPCVAKTTCTLQKLQNRAKNADLRANARCRNYIFEQNEELTMKICVKTEPIPAARPRFGNGRTYQPKRNREYRQAVKTAAVAAMTGREPMTGEVSARISLFRRFKPTARNYGDCDNPRAEIELSEVLAVKNSEERAR